MSGNMSERSAEECVRHLGCLGDLPRTATPPSATIKRSVDSSTASMPIKITQLHVTKCFAAGRAGGDIT